MNAALNKQHREKQQAALQANPITSVTPALLSVRAANTPRTPALQRVKPEYHALISHYMDLDVDNWKDKSSTLLTLLLESGHSVDIDDGQNEFRSVAVGKFGAAYSARAELMGDALIIATARFIEFLNGTGVSSLHKNIQRQKSAMPLSTAIEWMKEGRTVRRVSWPHSWKLSIHPGYMTEDTEVINGCVLGIPRSHYIAVSAESLPTPESAPCKEPLFIMSVDGSDMEWKVTAKEALATDWLVDEL